MNYAYIDGACFPTNPGERGTASCVFMVDEDISEILVHFCPTETTNNRMELGALLMALNLYKRHEPIIIYSDSAYVVNCFSKWIRGWERYGYEGKKNQDILRELATHINRKNISVQWVPGHSGIMWNELADKLCSLPFHVHQAQTFVFGDPDTPLLNNAIHKLLKKLNICPALAS